MGDVAHLIPDDQADVCILEEPEHLSWSASSSNLVLIASIIGYDLTKQVQGPFCGERLDR